MGGFALGPAIVASMLGYGGFVIVSWIGLLFLCLSLLLIGPLAIKLDKTERTPDVPVETSEIGTS